MPPPCLGAPFTGHLRITLTLVFDMFSRLEDDDRRPTRVGWGGFAVAGFMYRLARGNFVEFCKASMTGDNSAHPFFLALNSTTSPSGRSPAAFRIALYAFWVEAWTGSSVSLA